MNEFIFNNYISIGLINFVNCLPINYALEKWHPENIIFSRGNPVLINELMKDGQVQVAPISSIEYLCNEEKYILIKEACISSYGECGSVILFSNYKIDDLHGKTIALPYNSASSVAMLKVLLKKRGISLESINFVMHKYDLTLDEMLKNTDAVLQIGDTALISLFRYKDYLQYDLGQLWKETFNLPAVFGVWAARADWVVNQQDDFEQVKLLISKAVVAGTGVYFNEVVQSAASDCGLNEDYIKDYLTAKIKYRFSQEHEKSLELFKKLYENLEN